MSLKVMGTRLITSKGSKTMPQQHTTTSEQSSFLDLLWGRDLISRFSKYHVIKNKNPKIVSIIVQNRPKCNQTEVFKVSHRHCCCEREDEFIGKKVPKADSGIVLEQFCVIRYVLIIIELKISAKVHAQSLTNISPPKKTSIKKLKS